VIAGGQEVEFHTAVPVPGASNNEAEYQAILFGLERAKELGASRLSLYSDSQLCVKQVNGEWACREPHLIPLCDQAKQEIEEFEFCQLVWIPRTKNQRADALAFGEEVGE
jgi:ribonuclease HI